jgi:uncharacterized Zn finger protein (UPF0148 family)
MTKKEREAHFISYINPNNSYFDNLHEYITKCPNCGCGLYNVAFYCPICGVKINERVVHSRDNNIIIYPSWILDKIRAEIEDTLYVDSLIFGELIDFRNGKISADDVIEEFNRVTRIEVLKIIDKYRAESEEA